MAIADNPTVEHQEWIVRRFVKAMTGLDFVREILAARVGGYVEFLLVVEGDRFDAIGAIEPALTELRRERAATFDYRTVEQLPTALPQAFERVFAV